MIDQNFCEFLEFVLTKAFANSQDNLIKRLWCEGVLLPQSEKEISKKHINDNRQIVTTAFIGESGQDKYQLTISLGKKALSRYARNLKIEECIPPATESYWYKIDTINKKLTVNLY